MNTQAESELIGQEALRRIEQTVEIENLNIIRTEYLGKKGKLSLLMQNLKDLSPEQRKEAGAALNKIKTSVEESLQCKTQSLNEQLLEKVLVDEKIDVTLPVKAPLSCAEQGSLHPNTIVQRELEKIFSGLGFTVVDGPEMETEYHCFEALNIPSTHPARDMQDTFFTSSGHVMRTHTSSMQARALERMKPPLRIVAPGRCFRCERSDAHHEHTFYQMEGMMIDKVVTVSQLIYFMKTLLREIFGCDQKIRLRPGYFPFVEPGFELDIWFKDRWLELLPCGLVHPKVLEYGGIDPNQWQGFAFGLGLSRLVMTRYKIDDIRHLQGGDLRFLKQFPRMILKLSE